MTGTTTTEPRRLQPDVAWARVLAVAVPICFALGAGGRAYGAGADARGWKAVGTLLVVLSLLSFLGLAATGVRRLLTAPLAALDERERGLRHRAFTAAHPTLVAVLAGAFVYLLAAEGLGLWLPRTAGDWQGVLFGLVLLAATLPAAHLAFALPLHLDEPPEPGEAAARAVARSAGLFRGMYGLSVAMGAYYAATGRPMDAMSVLGIGLIFDPFDAAVPFPRRPRWQQAWLLIHLVVVFALLVAGLLARGR